MNVREQLARIPYWSLDAPEARGDTVEARGPTRRELLVPGVLFALTLLTTTLANGFLYGACVVAILLVHEMGHYLMCRRYAVPSTLPYFIPLPPQISFLGTLGAVIRMRLRTGERRILYDIGIAGPLAGLAVALPVSVLGLALSRVVEGPMPTPGLVLGDSLIFSLLQRIVLGDVDSSAVVLLHPVALAGWTGLFVTGLNLIPIGMLDGGHVAYGLLGRRSIWLSFVCLGGLGLLGALVFSGWFVWFALLLVLGVKHPATKLRSAPLDRRRILLGLAALAVFVLCFVPHPFAISP
ncbi:MAG: site-2 protease family protein [Candidatus Eisenbacteria bacterium]|nr:site-2 protease family protein [Candidatus Eisenbacteria bacterium]